jgi:hypothetical protein
MVPHIFGDGKNIDPVKIKKIYDGFKIKDLPFEEFCTQVQELADPLKMSRDLNTIMAKKRGF